MRAGARDRTVVLAIGASFLACGLFLASGGVWERVGSPDLHAIFVSKYAAVARAYAEHRLPLWNPTELCGLPLLGLSHPAAFYPPIVVAFLFLPPPSALQAVLVFHLALLAMGSALYLRDCGVRGLAPGLGGVLAIAGVFSTLGMHGVDHPPHLAAAAWFPIMLLCSRRAVRERSLRWLVLFAIAACQQWIVGFPETGMDTAVLLALLALADDVGSLARRTAFLVLGLTLGAMLAAIQLVPLAEVVGETVRSNAARDYAGWRDAVFAVRSFADLSRSPLKPTFAAALGLAAWAAVAWPRRLRWGWIAGLLLCTFVFTPPLSIIFHVFPFSRVRFPYAWSHLGAVLLALLAAAGAAAALASRIRAIRVGGSALALVAAVQSLAIITLAPTWFRMPAPDYGRLAEHARVLREARDRLDPQARVLSHDLFESGGSLWHGVPSPAGYERPVPPRRIVEVLERLELDLQVDRESWRALARNPDLGAMLGVGFVVVPEVASGEMVAAGFERVRDVGQRRVLMFRRPWPRARLVHRAIVTTDEASTLDLLSTRAGELREQVVLAADAAVVRALAEPPPASRERAEIVVDEPERVVVEVSAAAPGLLVLSDTFYPGWSATVDGAPAEILRANHAFRAVAVPAGDHRVELEYFPASLLAGAALSALGLCAAVALWAVDGRARWRRGGGSRTVER